MQGPLSSAIRDGQGSAELDFGGINGITPSFFDELLCIIDEAISRLPGGCHSVIIKTPPTNVSPMFEAVARVHGLKIEQANGGEWVISRLVEAS